MFHICKELKQFIGLRACLMALLTINFEVLSCQLILGLVVVKAACRPECIHIMAFHAVVRQRLLVVIVVTGQAILL
jgi:hypothetical protein